ncbi:hypothetical protein ACFOLA_05950 [Salinicoccus hispanicus]|uniref:Uncharacterized protein n=1 Tax=Salinicoccus hispanicus TaxID=157225 RepID=A0A6N8U4A8_9STAP|nr:hypothetical protein [Salinicoccus hispanicus]MXQ51305.1 hypothetical protein [Salinicoccus hispanicus]
MVRLIEQKESPKNLARPRRSNMEQRWEADAKWFEEDAKKHPGKYQSQRDELKVTSKEMEEHLQKFMNESNQPSVKEVPTAYGKNRKWRSSVTFPKKNKTSRRSLKSTLTGYRPKNK